MEKERVVAMKKEEEERTAKWDEEKSLQIEQAEEM